MSPQNIIHEEDFTDSKLSENWTWLRERPNHWRLNGSGLEIRVEPGLADTVVNALICPAPDRTKNSYSIEVSAVNLNPPTNQYEQIGITWYSNNKPIFKLVKELIDGDVYIIPGRCPVPDETIHLRLTVDATSWEAAYRLDNQINYQIADSGELPIADSDQISLQCYNGPTDAEHWVKFQDFRIVRND